MRHHAVKKKGPYEVSVQILEFTSTHIQVTVQAVKGSETYTKEDEVPYDCAIFEDRRGEPLPGLLRFKDGECVGGSKKKIALLIINELEFRKEFWVGDFLAWGDELQYFSLD